MIRFAQVMSAALLLLLTVGVHAQEQVDAQLDMNEAQVEPDVETVDAVEDQSEAVETDDIVSEEVAVEAEESYPVTLNFSDTDLLVVLNTLAELRPNTSVVIDPGVSGAVTINIKQIPWQKALELILEPRGLEYEMEGENIYHIQSADQEEEQGEIDEQYNENLTITLYTAEEINELSDDQVRKLYGHKPGDAPISEAQIKEKLIASEVPFIKKLKVREQPTSDVLHAIAQAGELNYSLSQPDPAPVNPDDPNQPEPFQEVDISIALKMVGLEDALAMIASRGGYACFYKKGIWEIAPNTGAVRKPLIMEHFEVEYLEVGNELVAALQSSLTTRGKITPGINKVLIVKDTEDGVEQVRRTLKMMDKPTPQVLIEARFFELTSNASEDVGFDWDQIFGGEGLAVTGNAYTVSNASGNLGIDSENNIVSNSVASNAAIFQTEQLSTALHFLKNKTNAEQLSNPKIVVASNKQATIHIGEQEPIIDMTTSTEGNDLTVTYSLNQAFGGEKKEVVSLLDEPPPANTSRVISGYLDLGTKLTVAPSVKTDEDIYLKVLPELTTRTGNTTVDLGDGITLDYPVLNVTSVYSEFALKNGQTVAIGGLVKEEEHTDIDKLPVLGEIPFIGKLFTHSSTEMVRSETIVFLTVKIVGAEDLREVSGVPVNSELAQPVIDEIREQDRDGAEYQDYVEPEPEERTLPDWAWNMYMDFE